MNCNPCCGCLPPITTYDPSVANNFPTILQQVEYLKALLKKYPSQQWFITQEKVTEETVKLDSTKIPLRGRGIQVGDFILGNTVSGTILIFQYTGAMTDLTYYVVEYVGIYTNQGVAEEALAKSQDALDLAQTNEQGIAKLDSEKVDKIPKGDKYRVYAIEDKYGAPLNFLDVTNYPLVGQIPNYSIDGTLKGNEAKADDDYVNFAQFKTAKSKILKLHKNDINDGVKDTEVAGIFFADNDYAPTFQSFLKRETGEYYAKMPLPIIKTLFGKKLYGAGNIDLFNHYIVITANTSTNGLIKINFTHTSSNNLKVNSLTDLKTLLGETFSKDVSGVVYERQTQIEKSIITITETGAQCMTENINFATMTGLNFEDEVTTV